MGEHQVRAQRQSRGLRFGVGGELAMLSVISHSFHPQRLKSYKRAENLLPFAICHFFPLNLIIKKNLIMFIFGDRRFSYVAQAGPTRQPPECWDNRYVPLIPGLPFSKDGCKGVCCSASTS